MTWRYPFILISEEEERDPESFRRKREAEVRSKRTLKPCTRPCNALKQKLSPAKTKSPPGASSSEIETLETNLLLAHEREEKQSARNQKFRRSETTSKTSNYGATDSRSADPERSLQRRGGRRSGDPSPSSSSLSRARIRGGSPNSQHRGRGTPPRSLSRSQSRNNFNSHKNDGGYRDSPTGSTRSNSPNLADANGTDSSSGDGRLRVPSDESGRHGRGRRRASVSTESTDSEESHLLTSSSVSVNSSGVSRVPSQSDIKDIDPPSRQVRYVYNCH